jgi:hypothetical protein
VLRDGRLKRFVNVFESMAQDVTKSHQRRKPDATQLQMIDQLLQVDRSIDFLCRMNFDVTVLTD